jgi:hypothetical protein
MVITDADSRNNALGVTREKLLSSAMNSQHVQDQLCIRCAPDRRNNSVHELPWTKRMW